MQGAPKETDSNIFTSRNNSVFPPINNMVVMQEQADDSSLIRNIDILTRQTEEENYQRNLSSRWQTNGANSAVSQDRRQTGSGIEGISLGQETRSVQNYRLQSSGTRVKRDLQISEAKMIAKAKKWLVGNQGFTDL